MLNIFIIISAGYLLLCGVLYMMQERMIFYPPSPIANQYQQVQQNEISFNIDNVLRHGWKISLNQQHSKTLLYFGGNAEDVIYIHSEAEKFNVQQLIAINHPGYGKSEGEVSQQSLYENALHIYDAVIKQYQLNAEDIIVMGRSLGSSVATYLAAHRPVSALVLVTPFDSIESIASQQYKIFPVKLLLNHKFPTVEHIQNVDSPVLMLAAEKDEIIGDIHLQNLHKASAGKHHLIRYPGVGHNTIQMHPEYYAEIDRFINSI